ncbi:thioesterase II family protein [Mycolicibacterium hippocampi]|uniref:Thioesterase TesA n=1 Tax=Mycolicibacterium hippocampi TaxID=659824 RepID=A0A7I9ZGI2_9MYCO|nr:alpha/beta fold hydrolase [Mycolicibacterium hippocampi]GFG99942.1 thioesterase [Mycolicibacterium hippocampi]
MTTPQPSRWVRNFHPAPTARARLVCLPHAGGSASYYFPMSAALAPEIEVYSVQYPGRQDRHKEPFVDSIEEMADQVHAAVAALPEAPTAFFGHSMGAVLAFEVARRFEALAGRQAVTVFASGSRAPSRYGDEREYKDDAALVDVMRQLGGTDPRVLNNPELLDTFLPAFRNDYRALQAYHRPPTVGIAAPVVVMAATDDPKTSLADARAWHEHTSGGGDVHTFTGGHFYLETQGQRVIDIVASTLRDAGP